MTDTPTPGEAAALPVAWLRIDPFGNAVPASPEVDGAFPVYREARAAALPTIEAIMALAFAMSRADVCCVLTSETKSYHENYRIREAARESLRAALARALPVGEERDAARLESLRDSCRLDWLVHHAVGIENTGSGGWMIFGDDTGSGKNLRAAIDSAMAPKGETP